MIGKSLLPGVFLFCLLFAALAPLPGLARRVAAQCAPPVGCVPVEPNEPPPSGGSGGGSGGSHSWSGYFDGRLNPAQDEYFSIWCRNDLIEVWGGVPTSQLMTLIPIVDVLQLGEVGSLDAGNGLTLSRSGEVVVVSGSNGSGAGAGSKVFSMTACTNANGGVPELPPAPQQPNPPAESNPPAPADAEDAVADVSLCLPGTTSMADFLRCLNFFAPDTPSTDYLYMIGWAITTFCSGGMAPIGLLAAVPALRLWRRRRK